MLRHDPTAAVEIMVEDAERFAMKNAEALRVIGEPARVTIRDVQCTIKDAWYMRYLREPKTKAPYVFGDDS